MQFMLNNTIITLHHNVVEVIVSEQSSLSSGTYVHSYVMQSASPILVYELEGSCDNRLRQNPDYIPLNMGVVEIAGGGMHS